MTWHFDKERLNLNTVAQKKKEAKYTFFHSLTKGYVCCESFEIPMNTLVKSGLVDLCCCEREKKNRKKKKKKPKRTKIKK